MLKSTAEAGSEARAGLPRSLEVLVSVAGLVVALPLIAIAAAAIRLTSRGPALFRQERVGRFGRPFLLLKLRTMREGEGRRVTAAGDHRITPVGRFLRRTKIDELPQLWNVISGDMALVGPRPEVPTYVDLSDPIWRRVLEIRPGITDLVSVRLRHEEQLLASAAGNPEDFYRRIMVPFKVYKYLEYESHRSILTDLRVLLLTALSGLSKNLVPPYTLEDLQSSREGPIQN